MIKTYTYKIKPNKVLEQKFEEHLDFRLAKSNLMEVLTTFKRFETWWDNRVLEKI